MGENTLILESLGGKIKIVIWNPIKEANTKETNISWHLSDVKNNIIKLGENSINYFFLMIERGRRPAVVIADSVRMCSICLNDLASSDVFYLPCSHKFHTDCINKWLETQTNAGTRCTCPECRSEVFPDMHTCGYLAEPPPPPPRLVRYGHLSAKERRRIRQRSNRMRKRRMLVVAEFVIEAGLILGELG